MFDFSFVSCKKLIYSVRHIVRVLILRVRYALVVTRLRRKYGKQKLKVGFLVSDIAKWKGQSVYDLMSCSTDFEPVILILPSKYEIQHEFNIINTLLETKLDYFCKNKMQSIIIWNNKEKKMASAKSIGVDVVFYQQPWDTPPSCMEFSKYALTFYFPYYMVNNFHLNLELYTELHKTVFRYIVQSEEQVKLYQKYINPLRYAGKIIGLGHPITDKFYLNRNYQAEQHYVIYAPHFSISCNYNNNRVYYSSTFMENGQVILNFAIKHPEIKWVFKPHPRLRYELIDKAGWSENEVKRYYSAWEEIGLACYDSNYLDLFLESKAMITDSSSFLTEFSCTGKPLIRLIPGDGHTLLPPNPVLKELYSTFYQSHCNEELIPLLESIVLNDEDPQKDNRIRCINALGLTDTYAAKNITEYIRSLLM